MNSRININLGDCLDVLSSLSDSSVDLVVTDCPYKLVGGGRVGSKTPRGGIMSTHDAGFKSGKVFGRNEITFDQWLPHVYRVLKFNTHCYIMVNSRNLKNLQCAAESSGFKFQNLLVWDKGNCTTGRFYMQACEFILMLSKPPAKSINNMGDKAIIRVKNIIGGRIHPSEKPIELNEILIKNSSNPGDVVLDPFMGSGSTGAACINLNRCFIGIELDPNYYEIAKNRLSHIKKDSA